MDREVKKSIQQRAISFQIIIELKSKFTRKEGSRVIEIHVALRGTTLKTSSNIHDFAIKLRTLNDDLRAIYDEYILRFWKINLHFVDNLTNVYDSFIINLFIVDDNFIVIDEEIDWQTLVNKAAKIEIKAKVKGARIVVYKVSTFFCN